MTTRTKASTVTIVVAAAAFLLNPQTPLGQTLWPAPVQLDPAPTGAQTGLFMLLGVVTALAFGAGVAFLRYGLPAVRGLVGSERAGLARAMHVATSWALGNWWLHDNLHMIVGFDAGGLLAIEYAFHVTLIIAAATLVHGFVVTAGSRVAGEPAIVHRG